MKHKDTNSIVTIEAAQVLGLEKSPTTPCGFVNRHYTGATEMKCVLPKGHQGDHQAPYLRPRNDGVLENAMAVWSDDAGIPVEVAEELLVQEAAAREAKPPTLVQRLSKADIEKLGESPE